MDEIQATQLQSLRAAQQFLDAHAPRLGTINSSGPRRRLDELVARAEQCLTDQAAAALEARMETRRYQQRRRELVALHMAPLTRIAQVELASTPDFSAWWMPRGKPTALRLEAAARGMAKAAAPHAAVFTGEGLPADFIAKFTAATDAMRTSYDARVRKRGERRSAATGLAKHLREGRQQLPILSGFLRSNPDIDESLMADWQLSTRIPRRTRRTTTTPVVAPVMMEQVTGEATVTATAVLLPPPPAQAALPAPAPMKLLTSGAPPATTGLGLATSFVKAILQPFRRKAG